MVEVVFKLCSHLLFIFFAFHLLSTVVEWERFFKVNADNAMKIRFLILLFSIALGYLVSLFFIGIYDMSRAILMVLYKVIFLILWYDSMDDFKNLE